MEPEKVWSNGEWHYNPGKLPKTKDKELQLQNQEILFAWKFALRHSTWGFEQRESEKLKKKRINSIGSHTRRARMKDAFVEKVDSSIVFERNNWICQICQTPVSKLSDRNLVDIASLDHIIPIARGGEHSYSNTQLAHLSCNLRKGASTPKIS